MRKRIPRLLFVRDTHAAYVAGGYLVIALAWIFGSDFLVGLIAGGDARISNLLQSAKGAAFVVATAAGLYVAIVWVDDRQRRLEEDKRLVEEMLVVSTRLEALGTLAGSLAHDFNNVLAVIRGVADLMKLENFDPDTMPAHIAAIEHAAAQANQMTREMMLFMHNAPVESSVANLGVVVEEALPVLKRAVGKNVGVTFRQPAELPLVRIVQPQVERCLLNLMLNARDALDEVPGKRIELGVASSLLRDYSSLFQSTPVTGSYVVVTVEDNGCGISRENIVRIFTPFFTTKPLGKGTGLGLTSVLKVLQTHDGWVEVDSQPGRGTRFSLFFPVAESQPAAGPDDAARKA